MKLKDIPAAVGRILQGRKGERVDQFYFKTLSGGFREISQKPNMGIVQRQQDVRSFVTAHLAGIAIALTADRVVPNDPKIRGRVSKPGEGLGVVVKFGKALHAAVQQYSEIIPQDITELSHDLSILDKRQGPDLEKAITKITAFAKSTDPDEHTLQ